jgi:hypothetical protein
LARRVPFLRLPAMFALVLAAAPVHATSVTPHTLTDLMTHAETIVVGTVERVSDGFQDNGLPYTEVTLRVGEHIRGQQGSTLTFRQFGLLKPRQINGRTYAVVSPEGWPTWSAQENVMVFLGRPAARTGLRTTVGLGQGKLNVRDGKIGTAGETRALFRGVKVDGNRLSAHEQGMLDARDPVALGDFTALVRRAADENWVAKGVMKNAY